MHGCIGPTCDKDTVFRKPLLDSFQLDMYPVGQEGEVFTWESENGGSARGFRAIS